MQVLNCGSQSCFFFMMKEDINSGLAPETGNSGNVKKGTEGGAKTGWLARLFGS